VVIAGKLDRLHAHVVSQDCKLFKISLESLHAAAPRQIIEIVFRSVDVFGEFLSRQCLCSTDG